MLSFTTPARAISNCTHGWKYPESTYPNATVAYAVAGAQFNQTSAPFYPSPWGEGTGDWADAYAKAQAFVSQLTLTEKVNLTTGMARG